MVRALGNGPPLPNPLLQSRRGRPLAGGACRLLRGRRGRAVVGDAHDEGGVARVAGIEDAAEFVVALEEGVGFVNEEGWAGVLNDAEEGGGADVGGGDGALDEFAEDGEEGG